MAEKPAKKQTMTVAPYTDTANVPVQRNVVAQPDGATIVRMSLDMANAPIPDRRYSADVAAVALRDDSVLMLFGQRRIEGPELRSLVIVRLFPEPVQRFFESSTEFIEDLRAVLARNNLDEREVGSTLKEPEQTVALAGNLLAAAYSGHEAVLDLYQLSPMVIHKLRLQSANSVPLDPVVRIDLPTTLLAGVFTALEAVRGALPPPEMK